MTSSGKVFLVGAGPGDPGLLTVRAADVLRTAEVLLHDALASDATMALAPASCERMFVGKRGGKRAMTQGEINDLMVELARAGKRVVRLKGGDPYVFGRGGEEASVLHAVGIPFEVVPGITSAIAAPAYAGIPVTHRDHNTAFTVITGHEDPMKDATTIDWAGLADPNHTLVFLMAVGNLAAIARRLIEHGRKPDTPVAVIENGTRPEQRTATGTLATIADIVAEANLGAPAVLIVGEVVRLRDDLRWFDNTPLFGKRVLITRPAHQAHQFAAALLARGIEPILASTISIGPPDDIAAAHYAIDSLATYKWVVFTSQSGVDAFFERLASLDADTRYLGGIKVAAIGSKTAERLREHGVRADLVPQAFVSEEVGRAFIEASRDGDRVLIFRAQEARDVLPQMLEDAGRKPHVVAAYKTRFENDPDFAAKVRRADVLTFTSASTVKGYAEMLGGPLAAQQAARGKLVACIGPITADAVVEIGLHVDVVADVFTTDGLLDALCSALHSHSS